MILVGFLVLNFRQILICIFSFMQQGYVGFIVISESTHFGLSKTIFTFPQYPQSLGIVRQSLGKLGSDPYLGPIRAQTFANIFLKLIKIISTVIL